MIKHCFKLIWNQKRKNFYIIIELFFLFTVLLISSVYLIDKYQLYNDGVGANIENRFFLRIISKDYTRTNLKENLVKLQQEIESLPDVEKMSYSQYSIPYIWSMCRSSMNYDSNYVGTVIREVDENFINVFDIEMITGENLKNDWVGADTPIIIDRKAAVALFEYPENAIGKKVNIDGGKKIIGVYDMLKRNEYEENYPSCFFLPDFKSAYEMDIVVKYREGTLPNLSVLSKLVFTYFDKELFDIRYASTMEAKKDNILAGTNIEIMMVSFVTVFLVLNIILGMIGIFGYKVKQRISEIGLRRAVGSSPEKLKYCYL